MVTILLVAVGPLRGDDPKKGESVKNDKAKIQGAWKLASLEADGVEGPPEVVAAMQLSFKGDKLVFSPGEPGFTRFTFKLDSTTKPPSFDMTHADGADKGKTTKGIYAWEGDTLKICLGEEKRPKDFTAKADSGQARYVLKRTKP